MVDRGRGTCNVGDVYIDYKVECHIGTKEMSMRLYHKIRMKLRKIQSFVVCIAHIIIFYFRLSAWFSGNTMV